MTNAKALQYAIANLPDAPAEVVEKWEKMLDQLQRKNTTPKKPTAKQAENEGFKAAILSALSENPNRLWSITEMCQSIEALDGLTGQRVSALVSQLKKDGKVERVEDKRKAFFKAA